MKKSEQEQTIPLPLLENSLLPRSVPESGVELHGVGDGVDIVVVKITDGLTHTTVYTCHAVSRLVGEQDAEGNGSAYGCDGLGWAGGLSSCIPMTPTDRSP